MDMQDTQRVATWLQSGATLDEVLNAPRIGLLGNVRFSDAAVRAFCLIHKWSDYRFSADYPASMDYAAIKSRISRCRRLVFRNFGVRL